VPKESLTTPWATRELPPICAAGLVPKALGSAPGGRRKAVRRKLSGLLPPPRRRRCLVVDLPVEGAGPLEVEAAGRELLLGELDGVDVVAAGGAVVGAVLVGAGLVAAGAVLVAAAVERLDEGVALAAGDDAEREEQPVFDNRAGDLEDGLGVEVGDLGDAEGLVGGGDEARLGDAGGDAQDDRAAPVVGAADPAGADLAAGGAAVLGVVAGLEDLDRLDELLDDRRAQACRTRGC
jgi:hypothetical protein